MWHDFLGQDLKMLQVIEGRVQQQMLGASFNELGKAIEALVYTSPDCHARRHVGIAIADTEPRTQAFLGAGLIRIDGNIDTLGNGEGGWVSLRVTEQAADGVRLGLKVGVRG